MIAPDRLLARPPAHRLRAALCLALACAGALGAQDRIPVPAVPGESLLAADAGADPHNLFRPVAKTPFPLTLQDAVVMAVESNLEIAAAAFDPQIRSRDEDLALTGFDPLYFANLDTTDSETPSASSLAGARTLEQRTRRFETGISKRMFTGGTYRIGGDVTGQDTNSIFSELNPTYTSHLTLSGTQPLLRGLGVRRNLAPWRQARNATANAEIGEAQTVARIIRQVVDAYWDLAFAHGDLGVRRISLARARRLLDENKQRFAVGQIIELDVISAEVDVTRREEDLILAEQRLKDFDDRLKLMIRPLDREFQTGYDLMPLTQARAQIPELDYVVISKLALESRWEIATSRLNLANLAIEVESAGHDLLPRLDLTGNLALNALDGHLDTSLGRLDDGDYQTWGVGLQFEVPLGNRGAQATLAKRQLQLKQALLRHRGLEDQVLFEVRSALRSLEAADRVLVSATRGSELAAKQLEKEDARYQEGLSTAFLVLDFQEDLATAQSNELLAKVEVEKAIASLELASGQILSRYGAAPIETPAAPGVYNRFGDLVDPR